MPRYVYECTACRESFEINHGMFHEQRHCVLCKRIETLVKVPSFSINKVIQKDKQKTGKVVDEFISDAKKELKQQKKEMIMDEYKK